MSAVVGVGASRTVSGKDLGQRAGGLAHHDGDAGVVLLHRGVGADEERAENVSCVMRIYNPTQTVWEFGSVGAGSVVLPAATDGLRSAPVCPRSRQQPNRRPFHPLSRIHRHGSPKHVPDGRAGLGGLAEEEAEFLEGLGEGVFSRHGAGCVRNRSVRDGGFGGGYRGDWCLGRRIDAGVSQWASSESGRGRKEWPWLLLRLLGLDGAGLAGPVHKVMKSGAL